ncbi:MAG: universal stress protein [Syntrophomonadaceae bacterium]
MRKEDIPVQAIIKEGQPGAVLTQIAENIKAALIVIGSHNRGSMGLFFMGSVSNYVLHNAACPVLVVKINLGSIYMLSYCAVQGSSFFSSVALDYDTMSNSS